MTEPYFKAYTVWTGHVEDLAGIEYECRIRCIGPKRHSVETFSTQKEGWFGVKASFEGIVYRQAFIERNDCLNKISNTIEDHLTGYQ